MWQNRGGVPDSNGYEGFRFPKRQSDVPLCRLDLVTLHILNQVNVNKESKKLWSVAMNMGILSLRGPRRFVLHKTVLCWTKFTVAAPDSLQANLTCDGYCKDSKDNLCKRHRVKHL